MRRAARFAHTFILAEAAVGAIPIRQIDDALTDAGFRLDPVLFRKR
jgi:hypothetical protein